MATAHRAAEIGVKMFFWKKKKEENYYKEFDYNNFTSWLNEILKNPLPENTKGINFNLYEEENPNTYGIQFVATKSFDLNDDDWACDDIFSSGENMYFFTNKNNWEQILKEIELNIKDYLDKENESTVLKNYEGIGLGFVDGDLIILYKKEK